VAPQPPNECVPIPPDPGEAASPVAGDLAPGQQRSQDPLLPATRWVFGFEHSRPVGLAVGPDQTVYVAADDGVYAIGGNGHRLWFRGTMPESRTTPVLAADGSVYLRTFSAEFGPIGRVPLESGGLLAVDRCGQARWTFHAIRSNVRSATLGRDGTVYTAGHLAGDGVADAIHALGRDGQRRWSYAIRPEDTITTPSVVSDGQGTLYAGSAQGRVYALAPNGQAKWIKQVAGELVLHLVATRDGQLYAATARTIVALDREGSLRWQVPVPTGLSGMTLALDGTLYFSDRLGFHAQSPDGTPKWSFAAKGMAGQAILAKDGTVYIPFTTKHFGELYALSAQGEKLWRYYLEPIQAAALGVDGTLYVATERRLYAITRCAQAVCPDDGSAVPAINLPPTPKQVRPAPSAGAPAARWSKLERQAGYDIYFGCGSITIAVVSNQGDDFPWYADEATLGPMKLKAVREEFRARASGAAGIAFHGTGFGRSCVERRGALMLMVHPGQDMGAAARRVGEWLVREKLRGEIDLLEVPQPVNH
jgi:outer membrane protein assembly factor BamB